MESTKCQILLIMSSDDDNVVKIREFLLNKGLDVDLINNADEGILKARTWYPDLIICQNQLGDKNGLQVYNDLYPDLTKRSTPFFLYMSEYTKEDVLIGLEMGVDSFIISPFDKSTLNKKVEHHLNRVKRARVIDSEQFKVLFETTPVAKFIAENGRMIRINKALEELTGISRNGKQLPVIDEFFDFSENETNALNIRKCMNGLKDYCLFNSVPLKSDNTLCFDIQMVYTDYVGKGFFMAEVVPAKGFSENGNAGNTNADVNFQIPLTDNSFQLTTREKEVLEWSAQGLPIKQIASILRISERTVEKHRANIMAKTETSSIVEAIYAIRRKMM